MTVYAVEVLGHVNRTITVTADTEEAAFDLAEERFKADLPQAIGVEAIGLLCTNCGGPLTEDGVCPYHPAA